MNFKGTPFGNILALMGGRPMGDSPAGNFLNAIGRNMPAQPAQPVAPSESAAGGGMGQRSSAETKQLDVQARAAGYPDYATMMANRRKYAPGGPGQGQASSAELNPENAMAWHPKQMLEYVVNKFRGAM